MKLLYIVKVKVIVTLETVVRKDRKETISFKVLKKKLPAKPTIHNKLEFFRQNKKDINRNVNLYQGLKNGRYGKYKDKYKIHLIFKILISLKDNFKAKKCCRFFDICRSKMYNKKQHKRWVEEIEINCCRLLTLHMKCMFYLKVYCDKLKMHIVNLEQPRKNKFFLKRVQLITQQ